MLCAQLHTLLYTCFPFPTFRLHFKLKQRSNFLELPNYNYFLLCCSGSEPLFIVFERSGEVKKSIGNLFVKKAIVYDMISQTFICFYNLTYDASGVVFVEAFKFILPHCNFFLVTIEIISLFVAGSFLLHSVPFLLVVQILFHSPVGFINTIITVFYVGISFTQLCK